MKWLYRQIVLALVFGQAMALHSGLYEFRMKSLPTHLSYHADSLFEEVPKVCRQILWVEVQGSSDTEAWLHRMERGNASTWRRVDGWKVKIGRKGVAPGIGKHVPRVVELAPKKEGDAKTPLGLFELPFVYGVAEQKDSASFTSMSYVRMTEHHAGVDDGNSRYYNQIVDLREVKKDWDSAEKMILKDGTYDWGIYVSHNPKSEPKMGSCIFIHLKKANGDSTSGCVAMSREEMEGLLKWMDPEAQPLLLVSLEDSAPN